MLHIKHIVLYINNQFQHITIIAKLCKNVGNQHHFEINTDSYFLLSLSMFHKIFEKQSQDDICYKYLMLPIVKMTFL